MPVISSASGQKASSFCFGTMQFGGTSSDAESAAVFEQCRAHAINFFDCAFGYNNGTSETLLGGFIAPERENLIVTTKCAHPGGSGRANILAQFDTSRKRLATDYIDVYFLHRWDDTVPLEETFDALTGLVQAWHVRHLGVSNFSAWQTMKALAVAAKMGLRIDVLQPMYSLIKRQAEVEILPMAKAEDMAVTPYSPLGGGVLTGKYLSGNSGRITTDNAYAARYAPDWMAQTAADLSTLAADIGVLAITLSVAWVARNPTITAPIISGRNPGQLAPSLAAMSYEMSDEIYARVSALSPTPPPATDRLEEA